MKWRNCALEASRERERLKNLIVSESAREIHYLRSEIAPWYYYGGSRKVTKANITESKRKWTRAELNIRSIDQAATEEKSKQCKLN